jgi:uncharacterized membrane-anchored protein
VTSLEAALRQIQIDLTEVRVSFALVGGLAVSARTEPRFTRDADLAVALASDAEAEALIHALGAAAMASEPLSRRKQSAGSRRRDSYVRATAMRR